MLLKVLAVFLAAMSMTACAAVSLPDAAGESLVILFAIILTLFCLKRLLFPGRLERRLREQERRK